MNLFAILEYLLKIIVVRSKLGQLLGKVILDFNTDLIATQEYLEGKVYYRNPSKEKEKLQ